MALGVILFVAFLASSSSNRWIMLASSLSLVGLGGATLSAAGRDKKTSQVVENLLSQGVSPKNVLIRLVKDFPVKDLWKETAARICSDEDYANTVRWLTAEKQQPFLDAMKVYRESLGLVHYCRQQLIEVCSDATGITFAMAGVRCVRLLTHKGSMGFSQTYANFTKDDLIVACDENVIQTVQELARFAPASEGATVSLTVLRVAPSSTGHGDYTVAASEVKLDSKHFQSMIEHAEDFVVSDSPRLNFI